MARERVLGSREARPSAVRGGDVKDDAPLLEVRNLVKHFQVGGGLFGGRAGLVRAVDGADEAGCGKTTTGRCILQLERPTSGQVLFEGRDLDRKSVVQGKA